LTEISTMLQRFKELATQGANGALSVTQYRGHSPTDPRPTEIPKWHQ